MPAEVPPALRRLLSDPDARFHPDAEAQAAALLRAHVLARVAFALSAARVEALLVKGAALALTVYPSPAARSMGDVDLLVRPADRDRALAALTGAGLAEHRAEGRQRSADLLGEILLTAHAGAMPLVVELHTTLDKIAARPIDVDALFSRSSAAPGLVGLFIPSAEDHALLVALHASSHAFHHPIALLDLELLLRRGLDFDELVRRARTFCLETVMYVAMAALLSLGAASVTDAHVRAFAPGSLRRGVVDRLYDPAKIAAASGPNSLGLPWILGQTPLRDDLGGWSLGLARYAFLRAADRLSPEPGRVQDASVPYEVPRWVRAFLALDRLAIRLENVREGLRDELLLSWIPPEDRPALTAALYAGEATYLPGGRRFESGLFGWERRALDAPQFPRSGRVLLGASGGGREIVGLVERGFEVVAFDPCAPFVESSRRVAPAAKVIQASYDDLVAASEDRGGPLAFTRDPPGFDAVVLGWGSLSHVAPRAARDALLSAIHRVAPRAPILASFALDGDVPLAPGRGRVRETLKRVFAAMRAPGTSEVGDHFYPNAGFLASLTTDEVTSSAWKAGYEIALFEDSPYPHALLVPLRVAPRGDSG